MEQSLPSSFCHVFRPIRPFDSWGRRPRGCVLAALATRRRRFLHPNPDHFHTNSVQRRRRDLRRRQKVNEDVEGTEMVLVSNLASAISHAFAQPDQSFLTNDGALPTTTNHSHEAQGYSDIARPSNDSLRRSGEFNMSGALIS